MKLRRMIVSILIVVLLLLTISGCNSYKPALTYGTPVRFVEELDIDTINIDQIANDDTHLYLLDSDEGVLRVFDLDGNYLYTLAFYDYPNGAFMFAVKDRYLYVRDPHSHVYVFLEGEFIQFIGRDDANNILESIDFEKSSTDYVIKFASVWKVCETGDVCVIKRPLYSVLYQDRIRILVIVGLGFAYAFIRFFVAKRKRYNINK
ncbi:MAG: hypothetical protein E7468_06730 [Ruminococcaceae bacterium]|nr:hypothetical protein [Oscillospiraceae bacterium]